MDRFLFWVLLVLAAICFQFSYNAYADTTYYSNQYGQPQGSASTYGNTTYYANQYGQPQGSASTYGGTTYYSNQYGQPQGSASNSGGVPQYNYGQPQWNPYIQPGSK